MVEKNIAIQHKTHEVCLQVRAVVEVLMKRDAQFFRRAGMMWSFQEEVVYHGHHHRQQSSKLYYLIITLSAQRAVVANNAAKARCAGCGAGVSSAMQFCPKCGKPLFVVCGHCSHKAMRYICMYV